MRNIMVFSMISLDGVMQAPGGLEEDPSGGFRYGGWTAPYTDEIYSKAVREELKPAEYLLGRKTYDIWVDYWPHHGDFWPSINENKKYIFSNTVESSNWNNCFFIKTIGEIEAMKSADGPDLHVWGSSELIHLLLQHDLVDELRLKIHPLLLGAGKKLFDDSVSPSAFSLVESTVTSTGVILARYKRSGEIKTGSV